MCADRAKILFLQVLAIALLLPLTAAAQEGPQKAKSTQPEGTGGEQIKARVSTDNIVFLAHSHNALVRAGDNVVAAILIRELSRQAFLIAARDELSLATRDAWLGSKYPQEGNNAPFEVVNNPAPDIAVEVVRGFGSAESAIGRMKYDWPEKLDYPAYVTAMERASRTTFVDVLKQQGFKGSKPKIGQEVPLPDKVVEQLREANIFDQFAAVRSLHALVASQGRSATTEQALARGYANLATLTGYLWNRIHKVFKARALLYAERSLVQNRQSPDAWRTRAYVQALAGLHRAALNSLAEAEKLAQESDTLPEWADCIKPYATCDAAAMRERAKQDTTLPLEKWLFVQTLEFLNATDALVLEGLEIHQKMPDCYVIGDRIMHYGGVASGHSASLIGIRSFVSTLPMRLRIFSDLPTDASDLLPNGLVGQVRRFFAGNEGAELSYKTIEQEAKVIQTLLDLGKTDATDVSEPPWSAIGVLIQETSWLQIFRRAKFERDSLGIRTDEWLDRMSPMTKIYRYRPMMETMYSDPERSKKAVEELEMLSVESLDLFAQSAASMMYARRRLDYYWHHCLQLQRDDTADELVRVINRDRSVLSVIVARTMLEISPHASAARICLLYSDWEKLDKELSEWEDNADKERDLAAALGYANYKHKKMDRAIHFLKLAKQNGSHSAGNTLAQIYEESGDEEKWLNEMKDQLKIPDYGLSHANINGRIANHFFKKYDWEQALPYAELSAASYAGWGLLNAAVCYEAMQKWDEAEAYYRANSERYEDSAADWYWFCKRTGKGMANDARALALQRVQYWEDLPMKERPHLLLANFYEAESLPEEALPYWQQLTRQQFDAHALVRLALCQIELERPEEAKASLTTFLAEAMRQKFSPDNNIYVLFCETVLRDLDKDEQATFDIEPMITRFAAHTVEDSRIDCFYFLGKYLMLNGHHEDATKSLNNCMPSWWIRLYVRTLAGAELLKHDIGPETYREAIQTPKPKPAVETKPEEAKK